jgi:hypothetical protein
MLFEMMVSSTFRRNLEGKSSGISPEKSSSQFLMVLIPCALLIFVYMDSASHVKSFALLGRFCRNFRSWMKCWVSRTNVGLQGSSFCRWESTHFEKA